MDTLLVEHLAIPCKSKAKGAVNNNSRDFKQREARCSVAKVSSRAAWVCLASHVGTFSWLEQGVGAFKLLVAAEKVERDLHISVLSAPTLAGLRAVESRSKIRASIAGNPATEILGLD